MTRTPEENRHGVVGIPVRPFLWTLDQIATMVNVQLKTVMANYIYYEGRSTGLKTRNLMVARNIAPRGEKAEWRVANEEMIRWFRARGFQFYEEGRLRR